MLSGDIKRITYTEIKQSLLLAEGRLKISEHMISSDHKFVVKVLSEIGEHESAVELALASKDGEASYAVMMLLRAFDIKEEESAPLADSYGWMIS